MIQSFNGSMLYLQKKIVDFNISDCTNCTNNLFTEQNSLASTQLLLIIFFMIIIIAILYELCK
jgi:hypothetical protein